VRVWWAPDGRVGIDATGKGAGRGAYVCRGPACWGARGLFRRLENALKTEFADSDRDRLAAFAAHVTAHGAGDGG